MTNSAFWTRISSLYVSQTSSVVLSTHNCELNTRIKRLYWLQPSPVAFAFKTASFGTEWVPALICCFCMQNSEFWTRITSLYGSQTSPDLLCMQNSVICTRMTSLYGLQPSSLVLCLQNSGFRTRLTSLYGSQNSSVDLSIHDSVLSTRIKRLYWLQPSLVVLCM